MCVKFDELINHCDLIKTNTLFAKRVFVFIALLLPYGGLQLVIVIYPFFLCKVLDTFLTL